MAEHVERGDSFDGSLEYHIRDDAMDFDVVALRRVGNSEGQGGYVMLGEMNSETNADVDVRRAGARNQTDG